MQRYRKTEETREASGEIGSGAVLISCVLIVAVSCAVACLHYCSWTADRSLRSDPEPAYTFLTEKVLECLMRLGAI